jgi:hypothetical protein
MFSEEQGEKGRVMRKAYRMNNNEICGWKAVCDA